MNNNKNYNFVTRRVRNIPLYFSGDRVSSALYKDSKGVSVNKDANRSLKEIIEDEERLHFFYNSEVKSDEYKLKAIVSVQKEICEEKSIQVIDDPLSENKYHAILQKTETEISLTSSQAKALAKNSEIIKKYS